MESVTTTSSRLPALRDDFVGQGPGSFQDTFFALPELVQHVVLLLDCKDWKACCFVSRLWYEQWCPYLWRVIRDKQPKDLSRHGHLIREMDLTLSTGQIKVSHIRDHCLNLTSLRLVVNRLDENALESQVLGLQPVAPSATLLTELIESTIPAVHTCDLSTEAIPPSMSSGLLSNTLRSLELHFGSQNYPITLSRLIKARKDGHLQNLQLFGTGQLIAHATGIDHELESRYPIPLSSIFSFLGVFSGLGSFSTGNCPIQDDISWTAVDIPDRIGLFPSLRHLGLEPETAVVFEKMIRTMPGVTELAFHGLGTALHGEVFPLISTHYPCLTLLSVRQIPQVAFQMLDEADTDMDMDMDIDFGMGVGMGLGTEMNEEAVAGTSHHPEWIRLLGNLPRLESLELLGGNMPLGAAMAIVEKCPSFKSLKTRRSSVSFTGLQYMLEECKNLRILDLDTDLPTDFFFDGSQVRHSQPPSPTSPTLRWSAPLERWTMGKLHLADNFDREAFRNRVHYQLDRLRFLKIGDANLVSLSDLSDNIPKELALPGGFGASRKWKFPSLEELQLCNFDNSGPLSTEELQKLRYRMPVLKNLVINDSDILREWESTNLTNEENALQEAATSDWDESD